MSILNEDTAKRRTKMICCIKIVPASAVIVQQVMLGEVMVGREATSAAFRQMPVEGR
jgi:hypothetical protein